MLGRLVRAALLLVVTACAAAPPPPPAPWSAGGGQAPDLRGTWTGTWGGAPLTLVVSDERLVGESGVYVGAWQVLGGAGPGFSGVLTFGMRGERVSVPAVGRVGVGVGRPTVLLHASGPAGDQYLQLALVAADRLQGTGESTYVWGPRGPAELTRQRPPATGQRP